MKLIEILGMLLISQRINGIKLRSCFTHVGFRLPQIEIAEYCAVHQA